MARRRHRISNQSSSPPYLLFLYHRIKTAKTIRTTKPAKIDRPIWWRRKTLELQNNYLKPVVGHSYCEENILPQSLWQIFPKYCMWLNYVLVKLLHQHTTWNISWKCKNCCYAHGLIAFENPKMSWRILPENWKQERLCVSLVWKEFTAVTYFGIFQTNVVSFFPFYGTENETTCNSS
jgi:hypothetical protein